MPADLRAHIRYPQDLFTIQANMYTTYHMQDPQVFYNKEDLLSIPRRTVGGTEQEMEPYYTIMRLPGETKEEFVLLLPFTPNKRDNMRAWLAARSDPPHYGKLIALDFPKAKLVYGPKQIEARIDQDAFISQQLSLWGQKGSQVIRGSLLAIPIETSLLYVQPLYLGAEKGSLPELKRVIVAFRRQTIAPASAAVHCYNTGAYYGERAGPAGPRAFFTRPRIAAPRRLGGLWRRAQEGRDPVARNAKNPLRPPDFEDKIAFTGVALKLCKV